MSTNELRKKKVDAKYECLLMFFVYEGLMGAQKKIRVMIAKPGLDEHNRSKIYCKSIAENGNKYNRFYKREYLK